MKSRLQLGGSLSEQEAQDQNSVTKQIKQEIPVGGRQKVRVELRARRCGICDKTVHNVALESNVI